MNIRYRRSARILKVNQRYFISSNRVLGVIFFKKNYSALYVLLTFVMLCNKADLYYFRFNCACTYHIAFCSNPKHSATVLMDVRPWKYENILSRISLRLFFWTMLRLNNGLEMLECWFNRVQRHKIFVTKNDSNQQRFGGVIVIVSFFIILYCSLTPLIHATQL